MSLIDVDTLALDISAYLHAQRKEIIPEVGEAGNILTVFFHDLIVHFSGILIHRQAEKHYEGEIQPPWVNKTYALSPYYYAADTFAKNSQGIGSTIRALSVVPLTLGDSIPYGYKQKRFVSKAIKILAKQEKYTLAYLPKRDKQIQFLKEVVVELCRFLEIPGKDIVVDNWLRYAKHHTCTTLPVIRSRGLLIGSRNNLHGRKLAVNFLQQDKKVIAMTHGEISNSIYNEPVFGYSEKTLCTELVDYGEFNQDNPLAVSLIMPETTLRRSSGVIAKHYRPSDEIKGPPMGQATVLYIPTMHQTNYLWGPFHAYEDSVYDRWQSALVENIQNLTIKIHPKTRANKQYRCGTEIRRLDDCITDYDILIIDYFATGAALAIFSDKPVIYIDIGLRKLNPEFDAALRKRCMCGAVDLTEPLSEQIVSIVEKFNSDSSRSNIGLEKFALCSSESGGMRSLLKRLLI